MAKGCGQDPASRYKMTKMSTKLRIVDSEFLAAARQFDDELGNFQRAAEAILHGPLTSTKHLERAAQLLNQIADSEQRLGVASQALSSAISHAHAQQQERARLVSERAQTIAVRSEQFRQLMEGYRALGIAATGLNEEAAELGRKKKELGEKVPGAALADELAVLQEKLAAVAEIALSLMEAARTADFPDVTRQTESVRQQLLAARTKLALFSRNLTG